jgi:hypothetical protein
VRVDGFKILGRVAVSLLQQDAGWCVVPESPRWTPVTLDGVRIERIRRLRDGDAFFFRNVEVVYGRGA